MLAQPVENTIRLHGAAYGIVDKECMKLENIFKQSTC